MYLKSGKKNECSGCTACINICPKNAIQMIEDEEFGSIYNKIKRFNIIKYTILEIISAGTKQK